MPCSGLFQGWAPFREEGQVNNPNDRAIARSKPAGPTLQGLTSPVPPLLGNPAGTWSLGSHWCPVEKSKPLNGMECLHLIITLLTSMKSKECVSPAQAHYERKEGQILSK